MRVGLRDGDKVILLSGEGWGKSLVTTGKYFEILFITFQNLNKKLKILLRSGKVHYGGRGGMIHSCIPFLSTIEHDCKYFGRNAWYSPRTEIFHCKREKWGPYNETKTLSMSEGQALICTLMKIQKSIIWFFGFFWHKLLYITPPKFCFSICQILGPPSPRLLIYVNVPKLKTPKTAPNLRWNFNQRC